MYHKRPNRKTPLLVLLGVTLLLPLLVPSAAHADIAGVIIGKYKAGSDIFCPDPSKEVCKRVLCLSQDRMSFTCQSVAAPDSGQSYNVILNLAFPTGDSVPGSSLSIQSYTAIP